MDLLTTLLMLTVFGEPNVIRFIVTNVQEDIGVVRCALYEDPDNWLSDDPLRSVRAEIRGDFAICVFRKAQPGRYAIAALHDEDRDGEMDKTLMFPDEGYTMSKDAHQEELLPDFDDAWFRYPGGVRELTAELTN